MAARGGASSPSGPSSPSPPRRRAVSPVALGGSTSTHPRSGRAGRRVLAVGLAFITTTAASTASPPSRPPRRPAPPARRLHLGRAPCPRPSRASACPRGRPLSQLGSASTNPRPAPAACRLRPRPDGWLRHQPAPSTRLVASARGRPARRQPTRAVPGLRPPPRLPASAAWPAPRHLLPRRLAAAGPASPRARPRVRRLGPVRQSASPSAPSRRPRATACSPGRLPAGARLRAPASSAPPGCLRPRLGRLRVPDRVGCAAPASAASGCAA